MVAVSRVLPWRRHAKPTRGEIEELLSIFEARHPDRGTELIELAYQWAAAAHTGQHRKSGEAYIHHPVAVSCIVAGQGLDDVTIAAALLHDALEDTDVDLAQLEDEFGAEVATIVDGVTKLDRIQFDSKEAQQAASMRKMLVAIAKDVRVLIIKLADRLHNMRTLAALPEPKQHRIARETLDIYAPLAHRLGMQELKTQLEDLAFASLHPKRYAEIDHMVATRAPERDIYLEQVLQDVQARLAELGIDAEVTGRPKHLWSIYEKMIQKDREFDDIFDLVGIRVIVSSVRDCYAAVGSLHATWKPVQGRFKDYIAMPKFNLYQSLHTTVIGPQGKSIEVQIRTREMHARAEHGVAAHWEYKEGPAGDLAWLSRIVDWQSETTDPSVFMANLITDLEQDEVFVFTPKGDVITLPVGATPVDFAYAVHTEVGHACIGGKVNGRLVSLDSELISGDIVEIFTSKTEGSGPSRDWLRFVASGKAKSKIKQWHQRERREDAIASGREELMDALRRDGLPVQQVLGSSSLDEVAADMNYTERDSLFAAIGEGHVSGRAVASRLGVSLRDGSGDQEERIPRTTRDTTGRPRRRRDGAGVHVEGLDDVMVRLSRCCTPVPGDEIMGFVTRGRGVTVHRTDCANAVSLASDQGDRVIDVEWDGTGTGEFTALIEVKAIDRTRLLRDVTDCLGEARVNIVSCTAVTDADRVTRMQFEVELGDASHLDSVLSAMKNVDSVYDAYRLMPGQAG